MVKQMEQRMLAKALYDNVAESPDEIAFRRGDVLTILEQDTAGLDGWWLCSLRGKQGIAPGNRLKVMSGMVANHVRSHTADFTANNAEPGNKDWRRSWDGTTNKVVTPQREGNMYFYDQPRAGQPDYDVPQNRHPRPVNGGLCNTFGSNKSSREDLDNSTSLEQSLYNTPPQGRSILSPDSSMYDTPPSHIHLDPYDIPSGSVRTSLASKFSDESLMSFSSGLTKSNPASMCDSARSSMDISPMDMYDVPPTQLERELRSGHTVQSSKDSGLDMYDSPPKLKSPTSPTEDYDVPKLSSIDCKTARQMNDFRTAHSEPSSPGSFLEDYDVPKSAISVNKSEQLNVSKVKSEPASPGFDEYDVPKNNSPSVPSDKLSELTSKCIPKRHKSNSLGSLLEDYDTPRSEFSNKLSKDSACTNRSLDNLLAQKSNVLRNQSLEGLSARQCSDDENSYDETDAVVNNPPDVRPELKKQEHAVDDLYDVPKNNAPVKNMTKEFSELSIKKPDVLGVYDIPPQVTRDSVISLRSDSSDGSSDQRMSLCSVDSGCSDFMIYDELPLDRDAANDLIIKLQQDVQKAINRFSGFIHSSWRKKDNIELKIYDIKQSCVGMESALTEFVEFGQGTLANSAKLSDRKLINKLSKYLIPLQQALQQIRVNIKHLDDAEWKITKLLSQDIPKRDDLGRIVSVSKDLLGDVKKLGSFIQGNSTLLFKRAKDFNRGSRSSANLSLPSTPESGKPPISRKPALPSKLQTRPLPAPPPTERPLPPTPTDKKPPSMEFSGPDPKRLSGEIKRNSGEYKHWSGEFQVRRLSTGSRCTPEKDVAGYKLEDLTQEYDYVQLEDDDTGKLKKHKQTNQEKKKPELVSEIKEKSASRENILETVDECVAKENVENDKRTAESRIVDSDKLDEVKVSEGDGSDSKADTEEDKTPVNKEADSEIPERDVTPTREVLGPSDRQVLAYYSGQLETHSTLLRNSIDAFFSCIENNQAPKVFISHSKFVVMSAHKLVYIGDTLHNNVKHSEVRSRIMQSANHLCDCLKQTVMATKSAALQYPSVPAIQEMVDRVVAVSHATQQMSQLVKQALEL